MPHFLCILRVGEMNPRTSNASVNAFSFPFLFWCA